MSLDLQAAMRDASVLRHHGRAERYHVVIDGLPACNRSALWRKGAMPLCDDFASVPAANVPDGMRCRRPGCAKLWPIRSGVRGE